MARRRRKKQLHVTTEEPISFLNVFGLPRELIAMVLFYLRPDDYSNLRQSCHQWRHIVDQLGDWSCITLKDLHLYPATMWDVLRQRRLKSVNIPGKSPRKALIKKLVAIAPGMTAFKGSFEAVKHLVACISSRQSALESISMKDVFRSYCVCDYMEMFASIPSLKHLKIDVAYMYHACDIFSHLKHLQSLTLRTLLPLEAEDIDVFMRVLGDTLTTLTLDCETISVKHNKEFEFFIPREGENCKLKQLRLYPWTTKLPINYGALSLQPLAGLVALDVGMLIQVARGKMRLDIELNEVIEFLTIASEQLPLLQTLKFGAWIKEEQRTQTQPVDMSDVFSNLPGSLKILHMALVGYQKFRRPILSKFTSSLQQSLQELDCHALESCGLVSHPSDLSPDGKPYLNCAACLGAADLRYLADRFINIRKLSTCVPVPVQGGHLNLAGLANCQNLQCLQIYLKKTSRVSYRTRFAMRKSLRVIADGRGHIHGPHLWDPEDYNVHEVDTRLIN